MRPTWSSTLKVKKVVIFDFQEPYSQGLASAVDTYLKAHGVTTIRLSAPNTTTDYSSYVTKVPSDADVVFFPTQQPPAAQTFAEQLVEQGKKAIIFGGDGSDAPAQYNKPAGGYVSIFAPDITRHRGGQGDHRRRGRRPTPADARRLRPADLRCGAGAS